MILNCRRVALAYSEEKVIFGLHPGKACGLCRGGFFTGGAAAKNGIFHKKQDDYNHDKWIGVGGKFERFESPEDCLLREVKEETGLTLKRFRARGLLTFIWGNMTEFIHLYTADEWTGEMVQGDACREGVLEWVPKDKAAELPIWEGDKIFFRLLNEERPYFSLKLVYEGDTLTQAVLDGKRIV